MGELSKNLNYNNGKLMDFDYLKENRELSAVDLSEGNEGLKCLFNVCFDKNIRTVNSCGNRFPHISFEINEFNRNYLINLFARLDLEYNDIFSLEIGMFKRMCDCLFLDVHINTSVDESSKYFKIISDILSSELKYDYYDKFDVIEQTVSNLSNYADSISITQKKETIVDLSEYNIFSHDFEYLIYINEIYEDKVFDFSRIINNVDLFFYNKNSNIYNLDYGIISIEGVKSLLDITNKYKSRFSR